MNKTYVILGCVLFLSVAGMLAYIIFSPSPKNVIKPGSCKILEEKYCKEGKEVSRKLPNGKTVTYVAFNFPLGVKVPLFALESGHVIFGTEGGNPFVGSSVSMRKPEIGQGIKFSGKIDLSKWGELTGADVEAGDIIGYGEAADAAHKSLGGYDLGFTVSHATPNGAETMNSKLQELFKFL